MWYVYILISRLYRRTYVGCSHNVEQRIKMHNSGRVKATKKYRHWEVIYTEMTNSYQEARKKEKYYKNYAGRKKIREIIDNIDQKMERCPSGLRSTIGNRVCC